MACHQFASFLYFEKPQSIFDLQQETKRVDVNELNPGDIVSYYSRDLKIKHSAIYLGYFENEYLFLSKIGQTGINVMSHNNLLKQYDSSILKKYMTNNGNSSCNIL